MMTIRDTLLRGSVSLSLAAGSVLASAMPAAAAQSIRPNPQPSLPGGLESKMNTLLGVVLAVVIFACVLGVLIVAGLMAVAARRGSLEDHMGRLGAVAGACVLAGSASTFVMFLI